MKTKLRWLLVIALTACGSADPYDPYETGTKPTTTEDPDPGPYNLTLSGSGFAVHGGTPLRAVLVNNADTIIAGPTSQTINGGSFSITWGNVLQAETTYKVRYYADTDSDGACEAPGEHRWEREVPAATADATLAVEHSTTFQEVCATFDAVPAYDLTFSGTGYTPHNGRTLYAKVIDNTGTAVQTGSTAVAGGSFTFTWSGILQQGQAYKVDFYVDQDQNGLCNVPDKGDHQWSEPIGAVASNVTLAVPHNAGTIEPVCTSFGTRNLTVNGTGYTVHNGQTVHLAVVADSATDSIVARGSATVVSGTFTFSWARLLLDNQAYKLHYYADVPSSVGTCDPPASNNNHAWETLVAAGTNNVSQPVAHNTNFINVCASF